MHSNKNFLWLLSILAITITLYFQACKKKDTSTDDSFPISVDTSIGKRLEGVYVETVAKYGFGKPTCGLMDTSKKDVVIVKANDTMVYVLNSYYADTMRIHITSDTTVFAVNAPGKLSADLNTMWGIGILESGWPCGIKYLVTLERKL